MGSYVFQRILSVGILPGYFETDVVPREQVGDSFTDFFLIINNKKPVHMNSPVF